MRVLESLGIYKIKYWDMKIFEHLKNVLILKSYRLILRIKD